MVGIGGTHMVAVDGTRLRCTDTGRPADGTRPALVLLHGFALSLFSWRHLVPLLADTHRVVAIDRPGFGGSDRPDPGGDELAAAYTAVGSAALVLSALRALDVPSAVLVGHSAGAGVALAAARDPAVRGPVLVAPVVGTGPPAAVRLLTRLPAAGVVGPLLLRRLGPRGARAALRRGWHEPLDPDTEAGLLELFTIAGWERPLWAMTRHQDAVHAGVDLGGVSVPTLVVACRQDRIARPAAVAALAGELPTGRLVHLEGCGHLPHEQRPADLARLVLDFSADLAATTDSDC